MGVWPYNWPVYFWLGWFYMIYRVSQNKNLALLPLPRLYTRAQYEWNEMGIFG